MAERSTKLAALFEAPSKTRARKVAAKAKPKAGPAPKARKLRRAEKSESNRNALIRAAIDVIGEFGYEGASVSRITDRAGLAQGTFYIYFPSRQDCFDMVLPELTTELLDYVASKVHGSADFFELEERGVLAFFEVVQRNPGLFRIVNEAQVAAPKAFARHLEQLITRYSAAINRGIERGDIRDISPSEVREVSFMLIGARNYLYIAHLNAPNVSVRRLATTYMKIVRSALHAKSAK